jgi:hypothetical protein
MANNRMTSVTKIMSVHKINLKIQNKKNKKSTFMND